MLHPDHYYESVFVIPYADLYAQNIRNLIFDMDNTLITYDTSRPPSKVTALIKRLHKMGFKVGLLSNNTGRRLRIFNENMNLPAVQWALKPLPPGMKKLLREMDARVDETVIIGDQLFTDILGGRLTGVKTVLVKPISPKEGISIRIKRVPEQWFIDAYLKKNESGKL